MNPLFRYKKPPIALFMALSAMTLTVACGGKSQSGGSGNTAAEPQKKTADKSQEETQKNPVAEVFDLASYRNKTTRDLTVINSKGEQILTAKNVFNAPALSHEIIAYLTQDPISHDWGFQVFNRKNEKLFELPDAVSQHIHTFKTSNTLVAIYDKPKKKLTVYDLKGQAVIKNVDAKANYSISDTMVAFQDPTTKALHIKNMEGNDVIPATAVRKPPTKKGTKFSLRGDAVAFVQASDGKGVAFNHKGETILSPTDVGAAGFAQMCSTKVILMSSWNATNKAQDNVRLYDSSGNLLRTLPSVKNIQCTDELVAYYNSTSSQWSIENLSGSEVVSGSVPAPVGRLKLGTHLFTYIDATTNNLVVNDKTKNERLNTALPARVYQASNQLVSYEDAAGSVILNHEGKQLLAPQAGLEVTLTPRN